MTKLSWPAEAPAGGWGKPPRRTAASAPASRRASPEDREIDANLSWPDDVKPKLITVVPRAPTLRGLRERMRARTFAA